MAFNFQVGSFTVPAATGNKAITGLSFTPKAVLFFANRRSADGKSSNGGNNQDMPLTILGMATGTSNQACALATDDFTGGNPYFENTLCLRVQNATGTNDFAASLVSLDASGFTLDFTTANATAYVVNYIALGGSDLSAKVVTFTPPTTANASFGITGAGFKPTGAIFVGGGTANTWAGVGFTDGTHQGANSSNFGTAIGAYERTNQSYVEVNGTTKRFEASIVSLDTDGCTLDFTTAATAGAMAALFISGVHVHVGTFNTATSTGNQTITGVGFTPSGMLLSSMGLAGATTIGNTWITHTTGAADGTNQGTVWAGDNNNGNASLDRTHVLHFLNDDATPSDMSLASLTSFNSDGFVLNYSTVDATAREVIYVAFGAISGASVTGVATLAGTLGLTATGVRAAHGQGTLVATLGLSASAHVLHGPNVSLSSVLGLSATGTTVHRAHATLSSSLALAATGSSALGPVFGTATLAGALALSASASVVGSGPAVEGSATLAGTLALTSAGSVHRTGTATLALHAGLSAKGVVTHRASAILTATLGLTAVNAGASPGNLAATFGLAATGVVTRRAHANLSATFSTSATGKIAELATASLSGAYAMTATGAVSTPGGNPVTGSATLGGTVTFGARAAVLHRAQAALGATLALNATSASKRAGHAVMSSTLTLAASGSVTRGTQLALNVRLRLSASGVVQHTASPTLTAGYTLVATADVHGVLTAGNGRIVRIRPVASISVCIRES